MNDFSKQSKVDFMNLVEGFNDALVMSNAVEKYDMGEKGAEQSSDVVWRPQPYIAQSFSGVDQTANMASASNTQLSVPMTVGQVMSSPYKMSAKELRDGAQSSSLNESAVEKLSSDVNVSLMNVAANLGSVVVPIVGPATGYDDIAECDAAFNETGVNYADRHMALSSRDYNRMAGDLAKHNSRRDAATKAYQKAFIGEVANFDTLKLDYANRLAAATATGVSFNGANQFYEPKATVPTVDGIGANNVDNRFQTITVTVGGGSVAVGDAFTVLGVNAVHRITKKDTGRLKTFRVTEILTGGGGSGTIKITPPIISGGGGSNAEKQYQNVTATPANGAAITFLNANEAAANPFWKKGAIMLTHSKLIVPEGSLSATTDQGITVTMSRDTVIGTLSTDYRVDVFYGAVMVDPEQAGIMIFGQ